MASGSAAPFQRPSERELRAELSRCCRVLWERGFTPGTAGNLSARLGGGLFLVTPSGMSKGDVRPGDLVVVDDKGTVAAGAASRPFGREAGAGARPTSEVFMHLLAYEARPGVEAVVHAHPATATGFACAGVALDQPLASEFVQTLGCAPLAPYGTPGTSELASSIKGLIKDHDALLLANHGVLTCGKSPAEALGNMEIVEHNARIVLTARLLQRESPLRESDVLKLLEARARYLGLPEVPARVEGCPAKGREGCASCADKSCPCAGCRPDAGLASREDLDRIVAEVMRRVRG